MERTSSIELAMYPHRSNSVQILQQKPWRSPWALVLEPMPFAFHAEFRKNQPSMLSLVSPVQEDLRFGGAFSKYYQDVIARVFANTERLASEIRNQKDE
jgi:hypothetical protein